MAMTTRTPPEARSPCRSAADTDHCRYARGAREAQTLERLVDEKGSEFLGKHMIPVILGRRSAIMSSIITISAWP